MASATSAVDSGAAFGFDPGFGVEQLDDDLELVPEVDENYRFVPDVTRAILAGFAYNRRVLVHGFHGTGKSTHVEQVAARLRWPLLRVNLDGQVTRLDLVGRDAIVVREGVQVTEFQEGVLPWALQRPCALLLDEVDAGRPDVLFVIQQVMERSGRFTSLDQNRVIEPHPQFRLFATSNTVGLGNIDGLYHGTQALNQAQLDRWDIASRLDYLPADAEEQVILANVPGADPALVAQMVEVAAMTRVGFEAGDLSTVMSPRTVIRWAENVDIFRAVDDAFDVSYRNLVDPAEQRIVDEYTQRVFGDSSSANR